MIRLDIKIIILLFSIKLLVVDAQAIQIVDLSFNSQGQRIVGSFIAFDSKNRPYHIDSSKSRLFGNILTLRDNQWIKLDYLTSLNKIGDPIIQNNDYLHSLDSMVIDDSDSIYAVVTYQNRMRSPRKYALLYSDNLGKSFQAYKLKGKAFLETFSGHNAEDTPPLLGVLTKRREHKAKFGSYYDLDIFFPEKVASSLRFGKPVRISQSCFGLSNHSGGFSFAVSSNKFAHIVFAEISDGNKGYNPTYVTTIDKHSKNIISKTFITNAPPHKIDSHSTPVISMDSKGHLHMLSGAHNGSFKYFSSVKSDSSLNWTDAIKISKNQTYATLIIDANDVAHTVYREKYYRENSSKHNHRLSYQQKTPGQDWTKPVHLVLPPLEYNGYSNFFHRLFIDKNNKLFVSFSYTDINKSIQTRHVITTADSDKRWDIYRLLSPSK